MLLLLPLALADDGWQSAPEPINTILATPWTPSVSFSPDRAWMAELERPALPPIAELAEPEVKVAGIKINPATFGPARDYAYTALRIRPTEGGAVQEVVLPEGARIGNLDWSADSKRLMFTLTGADGIALWVVDVDGEARQLSGPVLNAAYGAPCDWLPGDEGVLCKVVVSREVPQESGLSGPRIEENIGRVAPARTYTSLLSSPHDEALFEHYLTSAIDHIALDGTTTRVLAPDLIDELTLSPDGAWILVRTIHRPFSYHVPASRFPKRTVVIARDGGKTVEIADLPLADDIPIARGSTRTGRRTVGWRSDAAATLYFVEALDGGDAVAEAEHRDRLSLLEAPFTGEPTEIWRSEDRFNEVTWGRDDVALVGEWWFNNRRYRSWRIQPGDPTATPMLLEDRSYQDAYADPGDPMSTLNEHGAWSLRFTPDGSAFYRKGKGASPEGVYPFLDRVDLATGESERLWRASGDSYEYVVDVLDDDASRLITRRESASDPPNYQLRSLRRRRPQALTDYPDPVPQLAGLDKELVTYTRADGVQLSATLYTPPDWRPKDGPLPTVFWAYPREHKDKATASQITSSPHTFSRPYGSSVLFLLTQGYAVVSGPTMPIIGEGETEPNDNYVQQLVWGAEAAVEAFVSRGVADPERLVIGGHSYGAFTAANLLAHTDLFAAGIARSGAYNRSLTPFGFQSEQRSYWDATDVYITMSPFTHAAKINEPLLMIHGAQDPNSGTYPMQSERMYEALKGLGATVRWVELPYESHGYRSIEAVGHVHWEMSQWLERWVGEEE
ncbi:MAG: dipeptidyl aminopeptidase/acylaminoacyl peptidase [Myxococcota bacterium]|jgi:dipeptidyl aminopeptidase/acylaminoacyl peptidase